MTPGPAFLSQPHDAIAERAADFLAQRRFGHWSGADQAALDAWLAESASHRVAWLRLEGAVARSEKLFALPSSAAVQSAPVARAKFAYRRFAIPLLAAASIAAFAAFGIPLVASLMQPPDGVGSTNVGGRTLLSFSDRTQIELNTDTLIRFRMTGEERTVWLEKGEAWFRVSHDASRPFAVVVGGHRVTDLGTEFVVRRGPGDMEVALFSGRAALSADGVQTAMLSPGEEAVASAAALSVVRKTPQQLADEFAWRQGMLVFHNAPLSEVVREFNRYNRTRLVIADPSIAGEKIAADLRTDDYESFLQMARDVLKLRVDREGNEILISREPKKPGRHAP